MIKEKKTKIKAIHHLVATTVIAFDNYCCCISASPSLIQQCDLALLLSFSSPFQPLLLPPPLNVQFHEAWRKLTDWLEEAESRLDSELEISNEPDKIKVQLAKHKVWETLQLKQKT